MDSRKRGTNEIGLERRNRHRSSIENVNGGFVLFLLAAPASAWLDRKLRFAKPNGQR